MIPKFWDLVFCQNDSNSFPQPWNLSLYCLWVRFFFFSVLLGFCQKSSFLFCFHILLATHSLSHLQVIARNWKLYSCLFLFVHLIAWFVKTRVATGTGNMLWLDLLCDGHGKCSGLEYFNFLGILWLRLLCGLAPAFVFICKCASFHCWREVRAIAHKALAASISTVSLLWCTRSALSPVQRFHGAQNLR